jgi:hypothetical protein
MRYAVVRVISSPTAGDVRTARLVVSDVPDKTTVAQVAQALADAGREGEFSEGGVPFGNHELVAEGRGGWRKGLAGIADAEAAAIPWARLVTPPTRNDGRRITLRPTPAEHSRYSLAAQRAGVSLQQWCIDALEAAASAAAVPAPAAAPARPARAARPARPAASAAASGGSS